MPPWYFRDVVHRYVRGSSSPARMIQCSQDLRVMFGDLVVNAAVSLAQRLRIKNLQAAKHRFQSFARPLGRMVRLIRQIIRLMERLARPGQNRDRKCKAAVFLRNVSAKDLLCCACLADISDECMAIVRFTDHEQFDSSQLSHELTLFLRRTVCAAKAAQHYHLRR